MPSSILTLHNKVNFEKERHCQTNLMTILDHQLFRTFQQKLFVNVASSVWVPWRSTEVSPNLQVRPTYTSSPNLQVRPTFMFAQFTSSPNLHVRPTYKFAPALKLCTNSSLIVLGVMVIHVPVIRFFEPNVMVIVGRKQIYIGMDHRSISASLIGLIGSNPSRGTKGRL